MSFRWLVWITFVVGFFALGTDVTGQDPNSVDVPAAKPVPSTLRRPVEALGQRMRIAGKERTTYIGEVVDAAGKRAPAQAVLQSPGLARLQGFGRGQAILSLDGTHASGVASRADESLLETFVTDFTEGMLASIQGSAAVRILGMGFGPDPRKQSRYVGPRFDVFEVTGPMRWRSDKAVRSKLYYFDSRTGLLESTRYYDHSGSPLKIETRFSGWQTIDGSAYPGRIEHYEGAQLVFVFTPTTIVPEPALPAAAFR